MNWLLIHGANALHALWELVKTLAGGAATGLDAVLNPLLSPVLSALNPLCTTAADGVYAVLGLLPAWLSLTILSFITGLGSLVVFRVASNQTAIARALDDIKANLLALKLYKDELRVTFLSQIRMAGAVFRLQRYMLTPVVVMLPPMMLVLGQMGLRHQWRPLLPGERTLIKMTLAQDVERDSPPTVTLEPGPGVIIEVGPVPGDGSLVWRVRAGEPGRHTLRFRAGKEVMEKEFVVGTGFERVSASRIGSHWTQQLLHPAERRLATTAAASAIEIQYPSVDSWIRGADWWLLTFFVVSMATAMGLKSLFGVRF